MSDISKIKLPNGDIYNLKDSEALHQGDATSGAIQGITKQGGQIVTITDAANNYPLEELKVSFEPYQEGSGDPSPENVRPISGWDGLSVFVSPTTTGGTEYPVTWQSAGTVYGGYVDLVRGVLVAEWQTFDLSESSWSKSSNFFYTRSIVNANAERTGLYCSSYKVSANNDSDNSIRRYNYQGNARVSVRDDARHSMTAQEFAEYMKDVQIVTELATPITYSLTPTEIRTFSGVNNFWSNIGTISSITYAQDTKSFIQENSVRDVQVNGASVLIDGVANVPAASATAAGVIKIPGVSYGIGKMGDGLTIYSASAVDIDVKTGTQGYKPITPVRQHESVFYGLTKAAGVDMASSSNTVGQYTDAAKAAIQHMIGTDAAIAPYEADATADRSYAIGDTFMMDGKLYKATAAIAQNGVITPDSNCVETCIDQVYVKDVQINSSSIINNGIANIPRATGADYGVAKMATDSVVKAGTDYYSFLTPMRNHISTFYGLAKAAGDTTQVNSSNAIGTYTTEAKTAIQAMLNVPDTSEVVNDIQINSTSIINNGVANIPLASTTNIGVMKIGDTMSVSASGFLNFRAVGALEVKSGTSYMRALTPERQHASVFYGLAKAAGTDMSSSSNAIGTYTNEAKAAIKSMLGVIDGSTGIVEVSGTTPTITAIENTRYVCGEVSTLSITPPSSGICIVRFTSGTTATVLTVPNTVIWPEWFDATTLEASRIYEICITDGVYGAVMSWPL